MSTTEIPYLVQPEELEAMLDDSRLLIVDVGTLDNYTRGHVPGAVFLDFARLNLGQPPAAGLLPPLQQLQQSLQSVGLNRDHHVVAYDDQGNGRASRLLWTLEVIGHKRASLLDGGLIAWINEGHAAGQEPNHAPAGNVEVRLDDSVVADRDYVLAALDDPDIAILDARSPEEHLGLKSASNRRGRIPGSVNLNWLDTMDRQRNLRLKSREQLRAMLDELELTPDREIITHCQTHHRSSHSFVMLRHMGFDRIRGYAGSWSEWASDPSLPVE